MIACLCAFLAAGGAAGEETSEDERAVLRVVKKGRAAILRDRPKTVCRLLTRRARRNSLILATFEDDESRPRPRTCVDAIGRMIDDERKWGGLRILRRPSYREFKVVRIIGHRAHVITGDDDDIYLLRRRDGWRGDFGSFAPFDGSSGR